MIEKFLQRNIPFSKSSSMLVATAEIPLLKKESLRVDFPRWKESPYWSQFHRSSLGYLTQKVESGDCAACKSAQSHCRLRNPNKLISCVRLQISATENRPQWEQN
jgi:hypothetical protein